MRKAIQLAYRGMGYTTPNPAVGCVVVQNDEITGIGYHQRAGHPHAEVNALRSAGPAASGAELFVTLEPCNHYGRTPPCTRAILDAGIRRVVIGVLDPNPEVSGGGADFLRSEGVQVDIHCLREECELLLAPFCKATLLHQPWIRQKTASSLDGRTATRAGHSKWITNKKARAYGQRLREMSDAILVGRTTVAADDPSLTFRGRGKNPPFQKMLWRVILDSRLSLGLHHKVFQVSDSSPTAVIAVHGVNPDKRKNLEDAGVKVVETAPDSMGRVDLHQAMNALFRMGIHSVLVEGGAEVHGSFNDAGIVDQGFFFLAPMVIGGNQARPAIAGEGAETLDHARQLSMTRIRHFGDNLMITGIYTDIDKFWH